MTFKVSSWGAEIKIEGVLQNIKLLEARDYLKNIGVIKETVEKYIDHKKRVCSGEFTSHILDESEMKEPIEYRVLSKKDRTRCFKKVQAVQISLVENLYLARRKYLVSLHSERLLELEKIKENSVKDIDIYFKKLGRRNYKR